MTPPSLSGWVFPRPFERQLDAHMLQRVFSKNKDVFFHDHVSVRVRKFSIDRVPPCRPVVSSKNTAQVPLAISNSLVATLKKKTDEK